MKKNLLLGFLILFVLNTSVFGLGDPKNGSDKPAINNPKENKLSNEEISRLSRRAEINNLNNTSLSNKAIDDSKNNLRPSKQDFGEHRHRGYYYGAAVVILVIILVLVLV